MSPRSTDEEMDGLAAAVGIGPRNEVAIFPGSKTASKMREAAAHSSASLLIEVIPWVLLGTGISGAG